MTKVYEIATFDGIVKAEIRNNMLMVKEGAYSRRGFDLTDGRQISTLKRAEWDSENAEEVVRYDTEEEARKALEEMDTDSFFFNNEIIGYTYYILSTSEVNEDGECIGWGEELEVKLDNTEVIEDVREAIRDEQLEENDDYLTNLFGDDRVASKKEIMESDRFDGMLWDEIIEDVNSDELAYYIAEEDFDFEDYELEKDYLKADAKGWIAGDLYKQVDCITGKRLYPQKKDANMIYNVGGNGGVSNRISLPSKWVKDLGVTQEDKQVTLEFKHDKIIISKK